MERKRGVGGFPHPASRLEAHVAWKEQVAGADQRPGPHDRRGAKAKAPGKASEVARRAEKQIALRHKGRPWGWKPEAAWALIYILITRLWVQWELRGAVRVAAETSWEVVTGPGRWWPGWGGRDKAEKQPGPRRAKSLACSWGVRGERGIW